MAEAARTDEMVLMVAVKVRVTADDLDSIYCSAESGIAYWAEATGKRGEVVELEPDEEARPFDLAEAIRKGLPLAIAQGYVRLNQGTIDAGDIDSEAADVIVQLGTFGRLIYG